jgi:hypothetical protein
MILCTLLISSSGGINIFEVLELVSPAQGILKVYH